MLRIRLTPLALALGAALSFQAAAVEPIRFEKAQIDGDVAVCSDLNEFVNKKWLAANPIPGDRVRGAASKFRERSLQTRRNWPKPPPRRPTAPSARPTASWATSGHGNGRTKATRSASKPIQGELDTIAALKQPKTSPTSCAPLRQGAGLRVSLRTSPDFKDSSINIAYVAQAGLGLPDRDTTSTRTRKSIAPRTSSTSRRARSPAPRPPTPPICRTT